MLKYQVKELGFYSANNRDFLAPTKTFGAKENLTSSRQRSKKRNRTHAKVAETRRSRGYFGGSDGGLD